MSTFEFTFRTIFENIILSSIAKAKPHFNLNFSRFFTLSYLQGNVFKHYFVLKNIVQTIFQINLVFLNLKDCNIFYVTYQQPLRIQKLSSLNSKIFNSNVLKCNSSTYPYKNLRRPSLVNNK